MMKWLFCGAGIVLLAALCLAGCTKLRGNTQYGAMEGGIVTRNDGNDAPKEIESTEITEFRCTISLLAAADPGIFGHRVYRLEAKRDNGTVHCTYDWYDRITSDKVTFETDVSFLDILQQIISDYDLAKHNGFQHSVSGLPDMYGHILDITYASEETIYASDNQSGFLASSVSAELITRFAEASGKVPELLPVTLEEETVIERENGRLIHTLHPILSLPAEYQEKYPLLNAALASYTDTLRTEYRTKMLRLRQAAQTVEGDFPELYAVNEVYVTRSDCQVISFYEKREELEGWLDTEYYWDAHTFDVKTGRELRFEDVFEITDELFAMLTIELEDAYPELDFSEDTHEILEQAIRENNTAVVCFALSPGCAHVFFTDYRFTPEHTGGQHITLSFEDYSHFFKPEWKTSPYRQMTRLDRDVKYSLADGKTFRMTFTPAEDGMNGEWLCRTNDFFGNKQEYRETFYNSSFEVYQICVNGRCFLYLRVPAGDVSAKTNVYEIGKDGISFVGQADCAMYKTVCLDPDRIPMIRLDTGGDVPVPVYGICKVGENGMPVWLETIEN